MGFKLAFKSGWHTITRKKIVNETFRKTELKRQLNVLQVCCIGLGSMIGSGVYGSLTPEVAGTMTGPAVVLSYLIAGCTAILATLAFAEFASEISRTGSTYIFLYVSLGEIWAFLMIWNLMIQEIIYGALILRTLSTFINRMLNNFIANGLTNLTGEMAPPGSIFSVYPDLFAGFLGLCLGGLQCCGVKLWANFEVVCVAINLTVSTIMLICGFSYANFSNWSTFFPFGYGSVIRASSQCFFAYVGLDIISMSVEETKNPGYTIPRASFISLTLVTILYTLAASSQTLMVSYTKMNSEMRVSDLFDMTGIKWMVSVVYVGSISGLITSSSGHIYILGRMFYALAFDGLLFPFLGRVNKTSRVPVNGLLLGTSLIVVVGVFLDSGFLLNFYSLNNQMGYLMVSACIILLRYQPRHLGSRHVAGHCCHERPKVFGSTGTLKSSVSSLGPILGFSAGRVVTIATFVLVIALFGVNIYVKMVTLTYSRGMDGGQIAILFLFIIVIFLLIILIAIHQQHKVPLNYKVPLVPLTPALCIFLNSFHIVNLTLIIWIRFIVWITIGLIVYLLYGVRHSKEGRANDSESEQVDVDMDVSRVSTLGNTSSDITSGHYTKIITDKMSPSGIWQLTTADDHGDQQVT